MRQYLDQIHHGECIAGMASLPAASIDVIFADPPYHLRLNNTGSRGALLRPNQTRVSGVDADWDHFESHDSYRAFTRSWLSAARRVLKPNGTIWAIGTYHNIYTVGAELQQLGFWTLNDVIWRKSNPMPNFRGRRFTNAHETLLWCAKTERSRYVFNYSSMKGLNEDLQMRSDWLLPICTGRERLRDANGAKLHPTQKPEALLYRVVLASTRPGQIVLDLFSGSATTAAICRLLGRRFIAFEQDELFVKAGRDRVANVTPIGDIDLLAPVERCAAVRVPIGALLESGFLQAGERLRDRDGKNHARIRADGLVIAQDCHGHELRGSIHSVGATVQNAAACNGWQYWYVNRNGAWIVIDRLRETYRAKITRAADDQYEGSGEHPAYTKTDDLHQTTLR